MVEFTDYKARASRILQTKEKVIEEMKTSSDGGASAVSAQQVRHRFPTTLAAANRPEGIFQWGSGSIWGDI